MLSILKTISHKILLVAFILTPAICASQSNYPSQNKQEKNISDQIHSPTYGNIFLKYSKKNRTIWIENKQHHIYKLVHKLEKNSNPELIGAEENIRFISKSTITINGDEFIGLIFAERSMRGDGGGECGSGEEDYFVAYKLSGNIITERYKKLINSCTEHIDLDTGDGNDNDKSVTLKKNIVTFRWLTYPKTDLYTIGTYDFLTNSISYKEFDRKEVPEQP